MTAKINAILGLVILAVAGYAGYELLQARLTQQVYRQRLVALADDYQALRQRYNDAVRRTAVTELIVADGQVSVRIRNATGVVRTIETPFSPENEIYVDYVVVDGRLWIRRIFDDQTSPRDALVIDPQLVDIDWDDETALHGKAAYRRLSDGTWQVTVTGDGALGLARQKAGEETQLIHAPKLQPHEPIEQTLERDMEQIGLLDLLWQAVSSNP